MNSDLEKWNRKAREQNIQVFKKEFKRVPVNYQEVLLWIANLTWGETQTNYETYKKENDILVTKFEYVIRL